jgi:hypothetical protein
MFWIILLLPPSTPIMKKKAGNSTETSLVVAASTHHCTQKAVRWIRSVEEVRDFSHSVRQLHRDSIK